MGEIVPSADLDVLLKRLGIESLKLTIFAEHNLSNPAAYQVRELVGYLEEGEPSVAPALLEFLHHDVDDVTLTALAGLLRNHLKLSEGEKGQLRQFCRDHLC